MERVPQHPTPTPQVTLQPIDLSNAVAPGNPYPSAEARGAEAYYVPSEDKTIVFKAGDLPLSHEDAHPVIAAALAGKTVHSVDTFRPAMEELLAQVNDDELLNYLSEVAAELMKMFHTQPDPRIALLSRAVDRLINEHAGVWQDIYWTLSTYYPDMLEGTSENGTNGG